MSISDHTLADYLSALGSKAATPGGGAAAALSGAQAAALISMVLNLSKDFPSDEAKAGLLKQTEAAITAFTSLADRDAEAFSKLMLAFKQKTDIEAASQASAQPPLACLGLAQGLSASIQVLYQHGNPNLVTDTAIAALLLENTIRSSELNVLINLRSIKDDAFKQAARQIIQDAKSVLPDLEAIAKNIVGQIS